MANRIKPLNKVMSSTDSNRCKALIHRFYLQDEPLPSEWATTRYVNRLLNGLGVVESN
ncbi:MAG: hypothetical protein ACPLPX_05200 [Candidatus Kapaibacteriota bacterium]